MSGSGIDVMGDGAAHGRQMIHLEVLVGFNPIGSMGRTVYVPT